VTENKSLEILKNAILLERRGKSFYLSVAEKTDHAAVRDFFDMMAQEEETHMQMLADQFRAYRETGKFSAGIYDETAVSDVASGVLNEMLKEKISAAGFESAAVSAAIAMEERAVALYSAQAGATDDPEEKKLYEWLATWERTHLNALIKMDRELTESIWNDNQFWPF